MNENLRTFLVCFFFLTSTPAVGAGLAYHIIPLVIYGCIAIILFFVLFMPVINDIAKYWGKQYDIHY